MKNRVNRYKSYPKYKESGVDWLGEIPEHWEVVQSKRLFEQRKERARKTDEQLTASQKYGIISQKKFMEIEGRQVTQVLIGNELLKHIEPNDFVISMRSFQGGLEYSSISGCVSSAYIGLIPIKHVNSKFFTYLFKSKPYIQALQSTSNLIRDGQALRFDNFSLVDLVIIPEKEQEALANYLDQKTKKIDTLIEKQQNLIELLKEKRQALISHVVTKGLDDSVAMKDSGIAWLGEVPEHWEVWKLSHAFNTIGSGTTPTSTKESYYNGNIPWVTTGELRENIIFSTKKMLSKKAMREVSSLKLFPKNSIIIAMYGATMGRLAKLGIEATTNQACCVITSSSVISNDYLYYWLLGYRDEIIKLGYGGGQPNISQDTISNLKISAPSIDEQKYIISYLDQKTKQIDTLIEKSTKVIELLKERREALISAVITGKIDVREELC